MAENVVRSVNQLTVGCQVLTGRQLHMRRLRLHPPGLQMVDIPQTDNITGAVRVKRLIQ